MKQMDGKGKKNEHMRQNGHFTTPDKYTGSFFDVFHTTIINY